MSTATRILDNIGRLRRQQRGRDIAMDDVAIAGDFDALRDLRRECGLGECMPHEDGSQRLLGVRLVHLADPTLEAGRLYLVHIVGKVD